MTDRVETDLQAKYPGLHRKASSGRSPISAIRLNCLACMGGDSRGVRDCSATWCALHPYRLGHLSSARNHLEASTPPGEAGSSPQELTEDPPESSDTKGPLP